MLATADSKVVIGFITTVAPFEVQSYGRAANVTIASKLAGPFQFVLGYDHSRDDVVEETRSAGPQRVPQTELTAADAYFGDLGHDSL